MSVRSTLPLGLSVVIILQALAPALHASWPEFRGPGGQGHSPSRRVPMRWSPEDNVRWKTELPGNGWSSPVVQAGRIYVTAAVPLPDSDDLSLRLIELDGRSGVVVRSSEVFRQDADSAPAIHSKNSHATPSDSNVATPA